MKDWLIGQLDFIYLVYGLASVLMGAVLWGLARRPGQRLPWQWLSLYGLLHGSSEWLTIGEFSLRDPRLLHLASDGWVTASYVCLVEFGRCGSRAAKDGEVTWRPGPWIHLPLLALALSGWIDGAAGFGATTRYVLALTGGAWAVWTLWRYSETEKRGCKTLRLAAIMLGLYALASGLVVPPGNLPPARWLNTQWFLAFTGTPVQLWRCAIAILVAVSFWRYAEDKRAIAAWEGRERHRGDLAAMATLLLLLVGGWAAAEWTGRYWVRSQEAADLAIVATGAATPDASTVMNLAAGPARTALPAYGATLDWLKRLQTLFPHALSCAMWREIDGTFMPIAVSPAGTEAESSWSREIQKNVALGLKQVARSGQAAVFRMPAELPSSRMMVAAPVLTTDGHSTAFLVVDWDGSHERLTMSRVRLAPISTVLLLCCLVVSLFIVSRHYRQATESLRKLSRAVEQSPTSIVITDAQGTIEYVNPKFSEVTGFSAAEVLGQNPRIFKSGHLPQEYYRSLWATITSGHNWRGEFLNRRKNGEVFWEAAAISPIVNSSGRITHFVAVKEDISERKRKEEEFRHSLSLLAATLESTADGIMVVDSNWRIVCHNRKLAEVLNVPEKLLENDDARSLLAYGATMVSNPAELTNAIESLCGHPMESSLDLVHFADGRTVERYSQPQMIDGQVVGRVWSFRDITRITRLMDEQQVNIDIAKQLLRVVNPASPRYVDLGDERTLFIHAVSVSSKSAGGDHYFARTLPADGHRRTRTVVSLKDQSGHEVNCILRSIGTDLIHQNLAADPNSDGLEQEIGKLNKQLCSTGLFLQDDFVTALTLEIDHFTRSMRFVSCGHPPLVLIRGNNVLLLPLSSRQGQNLPLGAIADARITAGECGLEDGDRVLMYTDGLTEMTMQKEGYRLNHHDFAELVRDIVQERPDMPVTEIVQRVLKTVAAMSGQEWPMTDASSPADDLTIIGLELEHNRIGNEVVLRPVDPESLAASIEELSERISRQWEAEGLEKAQTRLRIVLEDAILNAWKHGNRERPGAPIHVRWSRWNDFVLEVIDDGVGFDPESVPDPRSMSRRLATSGRGIFMIRKMCDSVRWRSGGRHVVVSFARPQTLGEAERRIPKSQPAPPRNAGRKEIPVWN